MATNLLLLETDQCILGVGSPRYEEQWGNLCLDILSYQRHVVLENEDFPWTTLYVGTNQSLRGLGVERERINVLGFEFNSGNYAYWRDILKCHRFRTNNGILYIQKSSIENFE